MGVSGVAFRQVLCLFGAVNEGHSSKASLSIPPRVVYSVHAGNRFSGEEGRISRRCFVSSSPKRAFGFSDYGFADNGHLDYYRGKPRCEVKKEKDFGAMTMKKKLKLLKGLLSEDLISEAAEVLIKQLQQVRSEEKEMKRKKKMEKAKSKASRPKESSPSPSSLSESEAMDMSSLRREVLELPLIDATPNSASATSTQEGFLTKRSGSEDRNALVTPPPPLPLLESASDPPVPEKTHCSEPSSMASEKPLLDPTETNLFRFSSNPFLSQPLSADSDLGKPSLSSVASKSCSTDIKTAQIAETQFQESGFRAWFRGRRRRKKTGQNWNFMKIKGHVRSHVSHLTDSVTEYEFCVTKIVRKAV